MEQSEDNWELSKENVQPLRKGRAMSTLQEGLSQQDSTSQTSIQQQKQAFELELRFYSGEDPLDVWDRYIKWAEQAFPQGGNESNLAPLLERAVKIFHQEKRYYGDQRYLNLWLKFAHLCSEPLDLYSYLHSEGIGILHAQLYIAWAEENEARGNYKKADSIFQDGIQCKAEPLDKLEVQHRQFQARVSRQTVQAISDGHDDDEDSEVSEPQRSTLADLKSRGKNKAIAPVTRVGGAIRPRNQGLSAQIAPPQQIPAQSRFAVFDENSVGQIAGEIPVHNPQTWGAPPPARAKENELKAGAWNSRRPPRSSQSTSVSEPPAILPNFTPYVEESAQQLTVTPCKVNPAITSVLSARKPGKEEDPLQRIQNTSEGKEEKVMYCKSKVFAGVEEFSLEEIRAEIYMARIRKKREEDLQASALRRQEMEKQIEQLEKQLKEKCIRNTPVQDRTSCSELCYETEAASCSAAEPPPGSCISALTRDRSSSSHSVQQDQRSSVDSSSDVPFAIFDESASETQTSRFSKNRMLPSVQRPLLAAFSKAKHNGKPEEPAQLSAQEHELCTTPCPTAKAVACEEADAGLDGVEAQHPEFQEPEGCSNDAPPRIGVLTTQNVQQGPPFPLDLSCDVPFTIFDESASETQPSRTQMLPPAHRPLLSAFSKGKPDGSPLMDELDGIEPLNEEPIVSSSDKNKTLFADPEDTCDFVRAAQLASTPFHRSRVESNPSQNGEESDLERVPLREKTPVCEESYGPALCIKKLSPILEASQEDTRSSLSSVSSTCSTTSMFASKSLHIAEKLELSSKMISAEEPPQVLVTADLRRQLLEPLSKMLSLSEIQQEAGPMPAMTGQAEVQLGCKTYSLINEVVLGAQNRLYVAAPGESDIGDMKGVAVKVDNQPVPWDFYITQQLKERLGEVFETHFVGPSDCFLFQDGCVTLYKDINRFSIADILQDSEYLTGDVILLIAYNLLSLVEKLHSVGILHGGLRLETILLDERVFELSSCTEMDGFFRLIDFSHSMDLRLCPTLTSLSGFPITQTKHGQQILTPRTSPYQVDLLGIADVVHFLIFRKPLQLLQEDSFWKISSEMPRLLDGNLWNTFFARILNTDSDATISTIKELKEEMSPLFTSCLQDRLFNYFIQLEMSLPSAGSTDS